MASPSSSAIERTNLCPCRGCTYAYQRGREDAAQAVEALASWNGLGVPMINSDSAVKAARGSSEK